MINITLADCIRQRNKAKREFKFWSDKIEEAKKIAGRDGWDRVDIGHKGIVRRTSEELAMEGAYVLDKINEHKKWWKYNKQGEVKALEIEFEDLIKQYRQALKKEDGSK